MTQPSTVLRIFKQEYRALPPLFKAVADVGVESGKVEIVEDEGDAKRE